MTPREAEENNRLLASMQESLDAQQKALVELRMALENFSKWLNEQIKELSK